MFITFEGIEGSSKTTQANLLSEWLKEKNVEHILTKEPGTILSKECLQIRKLLLSPDNDLSSRSELLLFLADRAQHVDRCIVPALNDGKVVVSDRYSWTTFVYQGFGRNLLHTVPHFREMLNFAAGNVWPDITFIMDIPVEVGLERAKKSNTEFSGGDRMEREDIDFHKTLRKGFLNVCISYPEKCILLNADKPINELHEDVKRELLNRPKFKELL